MTRVKPVAGEKELSEQLVAEHLEMELVKEGYVSRTPEGLIFEGPRWNYAIEIRSFRIPKDQTVRLVE